MVDLRGPKQVELWQPEAADERTDRHEARIVVDHSRMLMHPGHAAARQQDAGSDLRAIHLDPDGVLGRRSVTFVRKVVLR
jgi:hypothetical protein